MSNYVDRTGAILYRVRYRFVMPREIVVFGTIPMAAEVLRFLDAHEDCDVVGVVTSDSPIAEWRVAQTPTPVPDVADRLGIDVVNHSDVVAVGPDVGFTVRYNRILSEDVLNAFSDGVVNFHGGHLPEYRGVDAATHVLLNGEAWHGVTLHYLDPGVDTGPVIGRKRCRVNPKDTSYSLYLKGERLLWALFVNNIDAILSKNVDPVPQDELESDREPRNYRRKDLQGEREVDPSADSAEQLRRIRAFDFPTHDPAFISIGGESVELRTGWNEAHSP